MKALIQLIIITVSGSILALLLIFFAARPILNNISALNSTARAQKTELAALEQQILAFKTAQSDLSKAVRRSEIDQAIPIREDLVAAVEDLEAAVAKSNITHTLSINEYTDIKLPKPKPVIKGLTGITEVPYKMSTKGGFLDTLTLISYLEHLPHFTEFSKIDLSAETAQGSSSAKAAHTGRVFGNFQGVFFIKQPNAD